MQGFKRPGLATIIKPRAVVLAVASCLVVALMSASAASAAVSASFDEVPYPVPRNTPVTVTLRATNPDATDASDVALAVYAEQWLEGENSPVTVQSYDCQNEGTKPTTLPPGTPAGAVACHWDTVAADGGQAAIAVTLLPADGAYVQLTGYQSVGGAASEQVAWANTEVALPKADLNVQVSGPAQLAVGETGQLTTTLNNVSGDSADGVKQVPDFAMFRFSTRSVDVLAVTATAGSCKVEPTMTHDDLTSAEVVPDEEIPVPDLVDISCHGGTLAPGGAIAVTVTVKGKAPGVVTGLPRFVVFGMEDTTPLKLWWERPEFRVGVYEAPAVPAVPAAPAFVDPTPLDQAELAAPAGGLLKVNKKRVATLSASCNVAAGCPQAVLLYRGGRGKSRIAGQAKLRALANGKTTTVTLKLTKRQFKALKAAKKKGIQVKITGAELTITVTLVAGK